MQSFPVMIIGHTFPESNTTLDTSFKGFLEEFPLVRLVTIYSDLLTVQDFGSISSVQYTVHATLYTP